MLLLAANNGWADGVILDWYSPITAGRGGTNIAHFDNGLILLENPASMMRLEPGSAWEANIGVLLGDITYSDPQNSNVDARFAPPLNPAFVPNGSFMRRTSGGWAWGVGFFTPLGFGTEYDLQSFAGPQRYRTFGSVSKILGSVAGNLTERLSVGASIGPAYGRLEYSGPYFLQTGALAGVPTLLDFSSSGFALAWNAGLSYEATDSTVLGLAYVEQTDFDLDGDASARIFGLAKVPLDSDFDLTASISTPRSLGVGLRQDIGDSHRFSADVIWYDWSGSFDGLDLLLTQPTQPALAGLTVTDTFPLRYRDSVSYKVGWESKVSRRDTFRTGYIYHSVASEGATIQPLIPATLEHSISAGYSRAFEKLSLNWGYAYTFGQDRKVGQSAIVGGDFSNSSLSVAYHAVFFGIAKGF